MILRHFRSDATALHARHHLLVPEGAPRDGLPDAARHLLEAARLHASAVCGAEVDLLAVDPGDGGLRRLDPGVGPSAACLHGDQVHVLMNVAFLLADPPPLDALTARAEVLGWSVSGTRSTHDTHALALVPARTPPTLLRDALRHLVAQADHDVETLWRTLSQAPLVPASPALAENSPALAGVPGAWGRRLPESPRYVNTALFELLAHPEDTSAIEADPLRLARALEAQRAVSRVPWIFNTLLNDVEHRLGTPVPSSFPPELHLSLTGACNIECRFCGYAHDEARFDRATVDEVGRLDFLRHARVLRLNSSLGEPTLNRHLPEIVRAGVERHPHLGLNLFTNGVSLDKPNVVPALVGRARWVNVSLNAATRETWRELCQADLFEQVCRNVRALTRAKRERRTLFPLLFGSTVLNRRNLSELPRLPALCRELGIDRLTGFPFYAFEFAGGGKYGASETLEACRAEYDAVYEETVREAERHQVSLEIPLPAADKRTSFGLEARPLFDFARVEANEWTLGRLLGMLRFETTPGAHCAFLWRQAAVGNTRRGMAAQSETHYLYPCLGPLCHADLSAHLPFRFPDAAGFLELWRNPLLERLRRAQRRPGLSPVCDACRACDTRDPREFARLSGLVTTFAEELEGARQPAPA